MRLFDRPNGTRHAYLTSLLVAALWTSTPALADDLTCIRAVNDGARKVLSTQSKVLSKCIRLSAKAALSETIEQCADPSGLSVARRIEKELAKADAACGGAPPSFGPPSIFDHVVIASETGFDLVDDLFGPDLEQSLSIAELQTCQQNVLKMVQKCADFRVKEFGTCKRAGLKAGTIDSASSLQNECLGTGDGQPDPRGKIAKKCESAVAKKVDAVCVKKGVALEQAFPACGEATTDGVVSCLDRASRCRVCEMLNQVDDLDRDCDVFDDGDDANSSCSEVVVCGDGVVDGAETCDDGGTDSGDGCSPVCAVESGYVCEGVPSTCERFGVTISTPAHGSFTRESSIEVAGVVTQIPPSQAILTLNGQPVVLESDGTFATTLAMDEAAIFNPIRATVEDAGTGAVAHDRVVVIAGDSVPNGEPSIASLAMRLADSGLDDLEPVLEDAALTGFDLAAVLPVGTEVYNECEQNSPLGCVLRVRATVVEPPPSIGSIALSADARVDLLALDVTASDFVIELEIRATSAAPTITCGLTLSADAAQIFGDYVLEPDAAFPSLVDVDQSGFEVVFDGFDDDFGGVCDVPGIRDVIGLIIPDLETTTIEALEDYLRDPDGDGPLDGPIADAMEVALAEVDISGAIASAFGTLLDAPYFLVAEDDGGVTFGADASFLADCTPPIGAPSLDASYAQNVPFPTFSDTTPEGGLPYDVGVCLSPDAFNQLLRAQTECGLLVSSVSALDIGSGPLALTAGLLAGFIPEFGALDPSTPIRIDVRPTLAPIVTGDPGPAGELLELRLAHVVADIVADDVSQELLIRMAVDASAGVELQVVDGTVSISLTPPAAGDVAIAILADSLGVDAALLETTVLPPLVALLLPSLADSLGSFPLPEFLGFDLEGVEVSSEGEFLSLFMDLEPEPTPVPTATPTPSPSPIPTPTPVPPQADTGTIVTTVGSAGEGELVLHGLGSNTAVVELDDDSTWRTGGGQYRPIAAYTGDDTADNGSIVTVTNTGDGELVLRDLATGTDVVLDDDWGWQSSDGLRGIAAYTGDGTPDNGTIVAVNADGELLLRDLSSDSNVLLDDDLNWSPGGETRGIAYYTGDGTPDSGTIIFTGTDGLQLRDLAADTSTLLDPDADLSWDSGQFRGIARYSLSGDLPTATPTPAPTASPSPTPTATPAPTASPSPAPTATPTPEPTASPSPAPTATPTPTPTASPSPAPTGTPTPAPTGTPTPAPTASPSPIPSASPSPTPASPQPDVGTIVTTIGSAGEGELVLHDIGSNATVVELDDDSTWRTNGGQYRPIAAYTGNDTADDGTIVTVTTTGDGELVLRDLATGTDLVLDDDLGWQSGDGLRGIAAYTGDGTPDSGTIVTVNGSGELLLRDLATDTQIVLDDDLNWSPGGETRGIANYTGDGTPDNGTILFTGSNGLQLRDLAADTSTLIDPDAELSWDSGQFRGIARYAPSGDQP